MQGTKAPPLPSAPAARMASGAAQSQGGAAPPAPPAAQRSKSLAAQTSGAGVSGRSVFDGQVSSAPAQPPAPPAAAGGGSAPGNGVANLMGNFQATMELQQLLGQGQTERAFAMALGKNDQAIMTWLCGKLEPKVLAGPPPMSQIIVMSLLQQLGADLQSETRLKVGWVKACLGLLNPADPHIAGNCSRMLSQLSDRLTAASDALGDGPDSADLSLLIFKVKKLLS